MRTLFICLFLTAFLFLTATCFATDGSVTLDAGGTGSFGGIGSGTGSLALVSPNNTVDMSRGFEVDSDPSGWTETDTGSKLSRYDTAQARSGSRSMSVTVDTDAVVAYQTHDSGAVKSDVSFFVGTYAYTATGSASQATKIIAYGSATNGGNYNCAVYYDLSGGVYGYKFRGSTFPATKINVTPGNWYGHEVHCVQNGTSTLDVYDANGSPVGSQISLTANNNNQRYLVQGQMDASAATNRYTMYIDDDGLDYTDATTPLWPFTVEN